MFLRVTLPILASIFVFCLATDPRGSVQHTATEENPTRPPETAITPKTSPDASDNEPLHSTGALDWDQIHTFQPGQRDVFRVQQSNPSLKTFCWNGTDATWALGDFFRSALFELSILKDDFTLYRAPTPEGIQREFRASKSWIPAVNGLNFRQYRIDPFSPTCLGVSSKEDYSITLKKSHALSDFPVICGVAVDLYVVHFLLCLHRQPNDRIQDYVTRPTHQWITDRISAAVIAERVLGARRDGAATRVRDSVAPAIWRAIQLIGLALVYFSCTIEGAAVALTVLLALLGKFQDHTGFGSRYRQLMVRLFRPKPASYISQEEFHDNKVTRRELKKLEKLMVDQKRSAEWMSKLSDTAREALRKLVAGEEYLPTSAEVVELNLERNSNGVEVFSKESSLLNTSFSSIPTTNGNGHAEQNER
ncbi:hypothetical protein BV898_12991 [Hypsibius exemplaris]|uniref:SUN domain-containing protein n=1 Tax=Hypsibius exemplaris TaxID=2072580 RepID=A0A1W0WC77_HYPEX|nr:hypothetical protein BV898_12991 [Hypsibius exemplaris]